jgi:putative ABC transport system permease protein
LINVLGLAIGLTCALQIAALIRHEQAFNRHVDPDGRVYRVMRQQPAENGTSWNPATLAAVSRAIRDDVSGVASVWKAFTRPIWVVQGDQSRRAMVCIADTAHIDYFVFPAVEGDTREILRRPGSAMITESFGKRLFGEVDPAGRTVSIDYKWGVKGEWVIEGLLRDPIETTTARLAFDFITVSRPSEMTRRWEMPWRNDVRMKPYWTWMVLEHGVSPNDVEVQFDDLIARHAPPERVEGSAFSLRPVHRMHLHTLSDYGLRNRTNVNRRVFYGDIEQIRLFVASAVLVLLIGAANFINLMMAQAAARAMEVGVRKSIGAMRSQLVTQFAFESLVVTFTAGVVALISCQD